MLDKQVCPNCGQLYDTGLTNCPLCNAAAQVIETEGPGPRKRITEAERKQRRADRKEAEQEARRRRKDEQLLQDAEEERQLEEASQRRKEERRRRKEAKKAAKRGDAPAGETEEQPEPNPAPTPVVTPGPARTKQRPVVREVQEKRDRTRTPRIFLILSVILLTATLAIGGSYLLWKLDLVEIPYYDALLAKKQAAEAPQSLTPGGSETPAGSTAAPDTEPFRTGVNCTALTLGESEITLTHSGDQTQITTVVEPSDTTDERIFQTSDESVVKVSPVGIVTAVSSGSAVITVTCGAKAAQCTVLCDFEDASDQTDPVKVDHLALNKDDMTFFSAGESYVLTVTNVPAGTRVEWKSMDEAVATVDENGHVEAVGGGTTRVIAVVDGLQAECWVRCRFE